MSVWGRMRRGRRDRERDEELRTHLALHIDDLVGRGVPVEDATRQAHVLLGNARVRREEIDDMQRLPFLETFMKDVRYAFRMMRRSPGFTVTAVVTLALVIGANTAVFTLANALLLKPLPFPEADRLAMVRLEFSGPKGTYSGNSVDGTAWQALAATPWADHAAVFSNWTTGVNLVVNHQARFADQQRVGAGFFRVLGVSPAIGREFTAEEDVTGGPAVAILSHDLWMSAFGGDRSMLGQTILLRGEPWQVIGILPQGFRGTVEADVWTPLRPNTTGEGGGRNYGVVVRVPAGRSLIDASRDLPPLDAALRTQGVEADVVIRGSLVSLKDSLTADSRDPLMMLGAAVMAVLLIACVNIAALLLARGSARAREIATRMALGSGRAAVIRQLMVESLVLAAVGGVAGIAVGILGLEGLQSLGGDRFSNWQRVTITGEVLLWCGGLSIVTSLLFGLVPAWQCTKLDVQHALVEGGSRSIAGGANHWTRRGLIVAQVSLCVVLLVSAGLLLRTFINLQSLSPGFRPDGLTTAAVSLQDARYPSPVEMNALFTKTLERLQATPGVEAASVSLGLPYQRVLNMGFRYPEEEGGRPASVMYVTPEFFKTFEIVIPRGRSVLASDGPENRLVIVVNESFARIYSKDKEVLGRLIRVAGEEREVVGVSADVQLRPGFSAPGLTPGPIVSSPVIYIPAAQINKSILSTHLWFSPVWTVRASSPAVAARAIAESISAVDPLLPLGAVRLMTDVRAAATAEHTMLMTLIGGLAVVALLLAAIGLHGLISHTVNERTREFGIRLALGATPSGTVRAVAGSGIALAGIGAVIGAALAVPASSLVAGVLYGVAERDPLTYVGAAVFLFLVAAAASVLPALQILRLDPATTLRQ
ncbi:MAG: ABC transporter permease [Vicinamibacterales bacterium]